MYNISALFLCTKFAERYCSNKEKPQKSRELQNL